MEECMEGNALPEWLVERREGNNITPIHEPSREWHDDRQTNLLRDVAFNRHSMNDGHHVSPLDNGRMQIGTDGISVDLVQGIDEESFKRTLTAATRATIGLDVSQGLPGTWEPCGEFENWCNANPVKSGYMTPELWCAHDKHEYKDELNEWPTFLGRIPMEDWEEMLKGGLQTALETQVIVFAVSGVSRTCTHQLVRSRKAAFHQQSQRASYMGDAPEVRMPESIWRNPRARTAMLRAAYESVKAYRICCEEDISYQDARYTLLEGTDNFILLEYPVREFLNVFAYRGCSMFSWEIVHVMRECRRLLVEAHPWMEPYVKISCEKTGPALISRPKVCTCVTDQANPNCRIHGGAIAREANVQDQVEHHCTFQGWESPEGQCDFPWAKDEARTFKPEFHRIGGKK